MRLVERLRTNLKRKVMEKIGSFETNKMFLKLFVELKLVFVLSTVGNFYLVFLCSSFECFYNGLKEQFKVDFHLII